MLDLGQQVALKISRLITKDPFIHGFTCFSTDIFPRIKSTASLGDKVGLDRMDQVQIVVLDFAQL
jgi:hypothetical protein